MTEHDIDDFFQMLDEVYDLMGKTPSAKIISAGAKAMFFRAVCQHPLHEVRAALEHHASNGTFTPVPKDINDFIMARQPVTWVSADEAWALVPKLESDTGLLNQVTAAALAVVQGQIDSGDMIGARVAFIKAYNARVEKAKTDPDPKQRVPVAWVSGGNQPERFQDPHGERMLALERGQAAGLLPPPKQASVQQLGAPTNSGLAALAAIQQFAQAKKMPQGEDDE